MQDLVLEGFIHDFAEARGIGDFKQDDLFEAFVASSVFRKYHQCDISDLEDGVLVGGSEDGGLDAVAIMVNGRPARTEEDVSFFVDKLRRLDVEFAFVQAKSSSGFEASQIGNFAFGVEQFFAAALGNEPKVRFNEEVQQLIDLTRFIYRQSIKMQENPKCFLYYVTAGKWTNAAEPLGRLVDGEERLRQMKIFSHVRGMPMDAELLKSVYRELERGVVKHVEFSKAAVFPRIEGVEDAYIGLLPGDQFIELVSTDDGELNRELFYDNVRDYQGNNPVNGEINHTLVDEQLRHNFPLLNNGVTIVARELSRKGDAFTIADFQIVNGCQTTHVLFQNRKSINAETFVPIKLLATRDRQVITEVIKATNRQTAVLPEALESLTPFHKELEDLYTVRESSRNAADRIYYERRSKQYAMDNISPKNIVSLTAQIKSFVAMFLNEPHSHVHYYGELLRLYEGRIFANDHRPEPYYAAGVALLTIERWLNQHPGERALRAYKYQMLMILRASIGSADLPRFSSNAIAKYSLGMIDVLKDPQRAEEECQRAAEVVKDSLTNFGSRRNDRNPPHRLRAFSGMLLRAQATDGASPTRNNKRNGASRRQVECGRIKWFDNWKNYGFIERDASGDIFVHGTEIGAVPWHLRMPDTRVSFKVGENPKAAGMQMAVGVGIEEQIST